VRRFAAATADPAAGVRAGTVVPPTILATRIWEAQEASRAGAVPASIQRSATGGVHGEHDLVVHRPIVAGEPLRTWVERHGVRPAGRNTTVTLRYATVDADGEVVAEQWWTTVYLGTTSEPEGDPAPDHAFPDDARRRPIGVHGVDVDAGMATRYAELSGDRSAHHFDVEAARASGFDRPFLHGLCTMALCAQGIAAIAAGGEPERLRRVAVRFASPMPLGERLDVQVHDAGPLGIAFEATCDGVAVITNGRAELR
jgi:acyl dehydratase